MLNLSNYIKHQFIKEKYNQSCQIVSTIEEAEDMANAILIGHKFNLIFESSYLKNYFFTYLKRHENNISIINCESSGDRLNDDINEVTINNPRICIFDHINNCDEVLLESIKKIHNSILVC